MTNIDQFESVFNSASKTLFEHRAVEVRSVLAVCDLEESGASAFGDRVLEYLGVLGAGGGDLSLRVLGGGEFASVEDLLRVVESEKPDLITTYRALHSDAWRWGHSLGEHLDVVTQATPVPVLVLPHPRREGAFHKGENTHDSVMAMTDHVAGDHRLVNYALAFTGSGGALHLANVEDRQVFERYMDAISKIPSIDTENARQAILEQLLKEAHDYAESCKTAVTGLGIDVEVSEAISVGHYLSDYRRVIAERHVDMLVLNTKDTDQLAMHGVAYALAVELNDLPLLLL